MVGVGKIYRDEKDGGHLHIPRRLMEHLNFANSEIVLVKVEGSLSSKSWRGSGRMTGKEGTEMRRVHCPLIDQICRATFCAWFAEGDCAIVVISRALLQLSSNFREPVVYESKNSERTGEGAGR